MAAVSLEPADLILFVSGLSTEKAQALIDDGVARAARFAPCILDADLDESLSAAAKGIVRDALIRRAEQGAGALQTQQAGPFAVGFDTRQQSRVLFWPSEITELQSICADHNDEAHTSGAYEVDTMPASAGVYGTDYWWTGPDTTSTVF